MANNYTEIMKIVNQGNKMGLSNTITRDNGIPLDLSSVQETYEAAVIYAATKAIAYIGQPVAVGDQLYIISDTAATEKFVATDGKEYDNFLKEVGSKTEGDKVTIDLEEGVLKLHGFDDALAGYIPQKKAIYKEGSDTEIDHYELEWVAISAIVEGDGNKITTLTSEDGSVTITKKTDTDESLVYDLKVEHPDVPEYTVIVDERGDEDTATTYHLTKDTVNTGIAIVVPDAYNDAALEGRVKAVEDNKANSADVYTKGEVDTAIDDAVKGILGEGIDEAYNTLKEIQDILQGTDGETIDGLIETVDANKQAIEVLNGTEAGSVAKAIADAEARVEETYATKQMLTDHSNTMDGKLAEYAKVADVNTELAKKVENATIAHTSEGVAEGVTKDGTTLKIVVDAYTKEETLTKIQEKITEINGGESAGEVLGQLNSYKETNDAAVAAINGKIGIPGEGQNDEGDTLYTLIAEAKASGDKGIADAATAKSVADGAAAQAETNKTDIAGILTRVGNVETASGTNTEKVTAIEGRVGALEAKDTELAGQIGTIEGNLSTLETNLTQEDARIAALVQGNTDKFANYYTKDETNTAIKAITGEVATDTTLVAMIGAKADQETTYTKTEVDNLLANLDQTEINAAIEANTKAIADLAGTGNTSTVKKNADDIAAINALLNAVDSEDNITSLKELAVWVEEHETEVLPVINAHDAILAGFGGQDQPAVVKTYIDEAIAAIPQYTLPIATAEKLGGVISAKDIVDGDVTTPAINAVYVAADTGAMSVKAISTDVLVNGAEEFILYGGNSGATQA